MLCEEGPSPSLSVSMFMSLVFLVFVKLASAVGRARASAALWGSALLSIGHAALEKDRTVFSFQNQ